MFIKYLLCARHFLGAGDTAGNKTKPDLQRLHVVKVEAGNEQINTRRQVVISAVGKASLGQVNRE